MSAMTDSRAADVLAAHNEWRRGGDGPQTEPVTLGLALERAIARLREPAVVGGFTAADMMDARKEAREFAQQPTADEFCDGHCTWLDHASGCPRHEADQPGGAEP